METSMFGFGSNLSQIDGRDYSPLLTADIDDDEDHEYNALNDETFGAEAVEEDWESDHEKLAAKIGHHEHLDNGTYVSKNSDHSHHFEHTAHDIVQSSIKHLVLDDELDDPAIMSHSIPTKYSVPEPIRNIFNRSPPLPAYIDSDLTGSPITEGIWSSPQRRDSSQSSTFLDLSSLTNRSLPHRLDEGKENMLISKAPLPLAPIKPPGVILLPNVKTVEELERDLLMNNQKPPPNAGVMTLEDVEREIFLQPKAKTVSEIESDMKGPLPPPPTPGGIDLPSAAGPRFPSQLPIGTPNSIRHMMRHPQPMPRPMIGDMKIPPPGFDMNRQRMPRRPPPPNAHMMPPPGRHPYLAHPMLNNMRHPGVGMHRQQGPPASMQRFAPNTNVPPPDGFPQHMHLIRNMHPGRGGPMHNGQMMDDMRMFEQNNGDPYAGLMTQREKDWLIKIQKMQLLSDNPYIDDYYYTLYKLKKMTEVKKKEEDSKNNEDDAVAPKFVLPDLSKAEVKEYMPVQYQGSLGKIQAVSVNNPRKMIDVVERNNDDDDEAKKLANRELRKYRKGLKDVEKLYDLLLDIDDIDKKVLALPQEAHNEHIEEKNSLILKLYEGIGMKANDKFVLIMSIRKGRRLFIRIFKLLDSSQQLTVLQLLLRNLATILKRDQVDQVLNELFKDVDKCLSKQTAEELHNLQTIIEERAPSINTDVAVSKTKNVFSIAIQSKFGISVIFSLLHHAESLYSSEQGQPTDQWRNFVQSIMKLVLSSGENAIATPLAYFPKLQSHFERIASPDMDRDELVKKLSKII